MKYVVKTLSGKYVLPLVSSPLSDVPYTYADINRAIEAWSAYSKTSGGCAILVDRVHRIQNLLPVGCLFDGNLGHVRTSRRIIYLAMQYGFVPASYEWTDVNNEDGETLDYETDDAIEYLNGFVPNNCLAGWHDGDFIVSLLNNPDDEI